MNILKNDNFPMSSLSAIDSEGTKASGRPDRDLLLGSLNISYIQNQPSRSPLVATNSLNERPKRPLVMLAILQSRPHMTVNFDRRNQLC
jgi:hypothetical protein